MANKKKSKFKKIIFISPRNPFSGRFSGDVIRAKKFLESFDKKYKVTVVALDKHNLKKKIGNIELITFEEKKLFYKILSILKSLLKIRPMQMGYFYSTKMEDYIVKNFKNFDVVFCQSVRAAQYVQTLKFKKKILDMGDLYSKNYYQTFSYTSFLNPIKYIYFFESILMKRYERLCFKNFNQILLFSSSEISSQRIFKNKIVKINFGIDMISNQFKYKKANNRILFIGNLTYLPNKLACSFFINNVMPKITKIDPKIEFHIVGEISNYDKFIWQRKKYVTVHGKVKNLSPIIVKSFCALANLEIASGIQTKILTYMSYGLPFVATQKVANSFDEINKRFIPVYKNNNELINQIFRIKNDKIYSLKVSKTNLIYIRKFMWRNVIKRFRKVFD